MKLRGHTFDSKGLITLLYELHTINHRKRKLLKMEREYLWGTNSLADIAETLTKSVQYLEINNGHGAALTSEFKHNLSTTLQELSLRITQLSSGGERKTVSGKEFLFNITFWRNFHVVV